MAESQWQPYCGADLGQGNALVLGATLPRREENLALIRSLVYNVNNNTFDHLSPLRSRVAFPEVMCGAYQADAAAASEAGQPGGTSRRFIGLVFSSRKLVGIEEFDPRTKRWRLLKVRPWKKPNVSLKKK